MKHSVLAVTLALLFVLCGAAADAQEQDGVTVGIKTWINDWTHDVPGARSIRSDYAVLAGPSLRAKFADIFYGEATYLVPVSNYQFSDPTPAHIEREDGEFLLGVSIVPGFGIEAGYKDSRFKEQATGIKDSVYGPMLGFSGTGYLDPDISFTLRLDYLFTDFRQEDALGVFQESSPGWLFDVGFRAALSPGFSGTLGYRYETNKGSASGIRDSFSGAGLGVMISF